MASAPSHRQSSWTRSGMRSSQWLQGTSILRVPVMTHTDAGSDLSPAIYRAQASFRSTYQIRRPVANSNPSSSENSVIREMVKGTTCALPHTHYRTGAMAHLARCCAPCHTNFMLNRATDALLVIDLQNDFCPGGALAVTDGDEIVPAINSLAQKFPHVVLTQDWHPAGHISFASAHPGTQPYESMEASYGTQALWPDHCVQNTHGADFHPGLKVSHAELILRKGFRPDMDSYSAFLENDHFTPTGLAGYLRECGLKRLFLCGLAYDFCVRYSAIDGIALDFECLVIEDATRPVRLPGSVEATDQAFAESGVQRVSASSVMGNP